MKTKSTEDLISVLRETVELLALPDNDFAWSSWENAEAATAEIESFIRKIESGDSRCGFDLSVLYAPTGPIQEVSLSSGWSLRFLDVAGRFDKAVEVMGATEPPDQPDK